MKADFVELGYTMKYLQNIRKKKKKVERKSSMSFLLLGGRRIIIKSAYAYVMYQFSFTLQKISVFIY